MNWDQLSAAMGAPFSPPFAPSTSEFFRPLSFSPSTPPM